MRSATPYMRSRQDQKSSCVAVAPLGQAGEGALEGVAVGVDQAGQHRAGEHACACGGAAHAGR